MTIITTMKIIMIIIIPKVQTGVHNNYRCNSKSTGVHDNRITGGPIFTMFL
jgi:hypothetical protein